MKLIILILCFGLFCCSSDEQNSANEIKKSVIPTEEETRVHRQVLEKPQNKTNGEQLSQDQKLAHSALLTFANNAEVDFISGWYALADALNAIAIEYDKNFVLPRDVKLPSKDAKVLTPPADGFTEAEKQLLAQSRLEMDQAITEILALYRQLEKYVQDDTLIDNGKLGRQITSRIHKVHLQFMASRNTWRNIVMGRARAAQNALLLDNPLKRQIESAVHILELMNEASNMIASGSPSRKDLSVIAESIEADLTTAQEPPFRGEPTLERVYRNFLRHAENWLEIFKRNLAEGFFQIQKNELALATRSCLNSYNHFVHLVNEQSELIPGNGS